MLLQEVYIHYNNITHSWRVCIMHYNKSNEIKSRSETKTHSNNIKHSYNLHTFVLLECFIHVIEVCYRFLCEQLSTPWTCSIECWHSSVLRARSTIYNWIYDSLRSCIGPHKYNARSLVSVLIRFSSIGNSYFVVVVVVVSVWFSECSFLVPPNKHKWPMEYVVDVLFWTLYVQRAHCTDIDQYALKKSK